MILPEPFYERPTLDVTRDLIGKVLSHRTPTGVASGIIVETEAYIGEDDPACHAAAGRTRRNQPLYGRPGRAYVYLNYGLHHLVNAVTEAEGSPAAVLIRALEPLDGLPLMRRRRAHAPWRAGKTVPVDVDLCRGPGNLAMALGISLAHNGCSLTVPPLTIEDRGLPAGEVEWSRRIGIRVGTEQPWRCSMAGHPCVSGKSKAKMTIAGGGIRNA